MEENLGDSQFSIKTTNQATLQEIEVENVQNEILDGQEEAM